MKKVCHIQRRHEICLAAVKIIASEGFEGLSTRSLAKSMNCSVGVLSHYFSSKSDLLAEAKLWPIQKLEAIYRSKNYRQQPTLKDLEHLLIDSLPLTQELDAIWKVQQHFASLALSKPGFQLAHSQLQALVLERVENWLLLGQQRGEFSTVINVPQATSCLIDWYSGFGSRLLYMSIAERNLQLADIRGQFQRLFERCE